MELLKNNLKIMNRNFFRYLQIFLILKNWLNYYKSFITQRNILTLLEENNFLFFSLVNVGEPCEFINKTRC